MSVRQNAITHVAFVVDKSGSMQGREKDVVSVIDGQIQWLAKRSADMRHETRVSVYTFSTPQDIACPIFDMDVLRVPSLKDLYHPNGGTALIDATLLAIDELGQTFQKRGQHSFLIIVITDGEENASKKLGYELSQVIATLPDNWTLAALVPNIHGQMDAERFGFPKRNIAIWDVNKTTGVAEAGVAMTTGMDTYMTSRGAGVTGTSTFFAGGADVLNKATVAATGMKPLDPKQFMLIPVANDGTMTVYKAGKPTRKNPDKISCLMISEFVRATGRPYEIGKTFYELVKSEKVQSYKRIAVVDKKTKKVYLGDEARKLLGLPNSDVRIRPSGNPDFIIYVESQSLNRYLPIGSTVLLLN